MRAREARKQLGEAGALYVCSEAVEFVAKQGGLEKAWQNCIVPGWMLHLLGVNNYFVSQYRREKFMDYIGVRDYWISRDKTKADEIRKWIPEYPI